MKFSLVVDKTGKLTVRETPNSVLVNMGSPSQSPLSPANAPLGENENPDFQISLHDQDSLQLVVGQNDQNLQQEEQDSLNQGMDCFPAPPSSIEFPPPTLADTYVSSTHSADAPLPSPIHPFKRPSFIKRKKGKPNNAKKQQAFEKKYQTLVENLRPIPFTPSKILDFSMHENFLRRLGLWDFVHIEFDRTIRTDLIAELIAGYESKLRSSYVNGSRIMVNRADLGRAFKLPVKKEKASVVGEGVEVDSETVTEDKIRFIEDLVSNWILLHGDTWMMPGEVFNWMKVIKDGRPEKVDWAGLFWFMVEKELSQGEQLVDCYYASHLQYLIKSQREDMVLGGEPKMVELDGGEKEEGEGRGNEDDSKVGGATEGQGEEADEQQRLDIELTLGKDDINEEEDVEDEERNDDARVMGVEEATKVVGDDEPGQWLLDGKNSVGDHFLQSCNMEGSQDMVNYEGRKEEDEEIMEVGGEEAEDGFHILQNDGSLEGDGLTDNLLEEMETNQMAFDLHDQFHDQSAMELLASSGDMQHTNSAGPSFYGNGGKRVIEHDMSEQNLNNKRFRVGDPWDINSSDFGMCMEQMEQLMTRTRMMYEAKEQAVEQSNMNQQILLNEVQKRDNMIEQLHKSKCDEMQKRDEEISRLERELYVMGNLLEGYRKAFKETQKAFAKYRQRFPVPEEPIYKDAGPGGLMLTTEEIERRRLKQEEEHRSHCLMLKEKAKEVEEEHACQFAASLEKLHKLDRKLVGLESEIKELKDLSVNRKALEVEQPVPEKPESPTNE